MSYPLSLSHWKAFIVFEALSYQIWEGSLTFVVMMVAQRVVEQLLSFKRLIEIVGGMTCYLTCPFILQAT